MTAAILTRLPLEAGGAVLSTTGRGVHSIIAWSFAHYMRAPLASTGIAAMLTLGLVASSNALYFQEERHPAPLFVPGEQPFGAVDPNVAPVVPAPRPAQKTALTSPAPKLVVPKLEAQPQGGQDAVKPVGNADVFAIQRRLESMKFFNGTVDGYYGPRTAGAIRAFETAQGMKPTGELTPAIIKAILAAPLAAAEPKPLQAPEPVPGADPLPRVATPQPAAPAAVAVPQATAEPAAAIPLPMPEPQVTVTAVVEPAAQRPAPRRELPATPQEAMNIAADTAGDAIETIINGVQSLAMTTQPEPKPAIAAPRPLQFGTLDAITPPAQPPATDPQMTASVSSVAAPAAEATVSLAVAPEEVPVLDTDARIEDLQPASQVNDPVFVARVQRGLASLGFLHGPIDGQPSEATARAIRTFETFYNYERTGRITTELPDLLVKAGATL